MVLNLRCHGQFDIFKQCHFGGLIFYLTKINGGLIYIISLTIFRKFAIIEKIIRGIVNAIRKKSIILY